MKNLLITTLILTASITPVNAAVMTVPQFNRPNTTGLTDKGYWTYIKLKDGFNFANLYTNPSKKSSVIKGLDNNTKVYVTGKASSGFREVIYQGKKGWLIIR